MSSLSIAVVVPTLNAAGDWAKFAPALLLNVRPDQVLILDSCSTDGTAELARQSGFRVHQIARSDFNHGGTRQVGAELLGLSVEEHVGNCLRAMQERAGELGLEGRE